MSFLSRVYSTEICRLAKIIPVSNDVVASDHTQIGIIVCRISTVDFFSQNARVMLHFLYASGFLERMRLSFIFRFPWKSSEIYTNRIVSYLIFQLPSWRRTQFRVFMFTYFFFFLFFFFCYFAQSKELIRAAEFRRLSRDQVRNICRV